MIEPVVEGVMQFQFQSIILYIIHDWNIPPFDLSSLLTLENNSVPYFYFVLFGSTILSVGVSYVRLLTEGRNPVIQELFSFKFMKILLMFILKFMIQSYFFSMAVKSLMYKFVSKVKTSKKYVFDSKTLIDS